MMIDKSCMNPATSQPEGRVKEQVTQEVTRVDPGPAEVEPTMLGRLRSRRHWVDQPPRVIAAEPCARAKSRIAVWRGSHGLRSCPMPLEDFPRSLRVVGHKIIIKALPLVSLKHLLCLKHTLYCYCINLSFVIAFY